MHTITNCCMRRGKRFLIFVILTGLAVQTACQTPPAQSVPATKEIISPEQTPLPGATISNPLEIYMDVSRGSVLLNSQPSTSGLIKEGDVITTGPDGFAWLYFYGDKLITVDIKTDTTLWVEKITPETTRLFLEVGNLLSKVRSSYGIEFVVATKAVEVVAKGTDFETEVDPEGNVEVTGLGGEVEVRSVDGTTTIVGVNQNVGSAPDGKLGSLRNVIPVAFDFGHEDLTDDDYSIKDLNRQDDRGFSTFRDVLQQGGYDVQEVNDLNDLDLFRVLIMMAPDFPLQDWEVKFIQSWVDNGHGLFVTGELPYAYDWVSVNNLLAPYGISMTGENITSGDVVVFPAIAHPVITSTRILNLGSYGPLQGGSGLGYDSAGRLVISYYEGIGRVLVYADTSSFKNTDIVRNDETIFLLDALKWLAGSGY